MARPDRDDKAEMREYFGEQAGDADGDDEDAVVYNQKRRPYEEDNL